MKETVCICAIMKNEHPYLDEWIKYHLDLGFTHIHLFEDRGSDPHDEICNKYDKVTMHKMSDAEYDFLYVIPQCRRQISTYNYFILKYHDKYDYCLIIDIDEFLTFGEGWNLSNLLFSARDKDYLLLWWKVYNANGHIERQESVKNYMIEKTKEYEWGDNFPKTLLNFKKPTPMVSEHCPITLHGNEEKYEIDRNQVWISHYYTKSWEDWCFRFLKKGQMQPDFRQIWEFFRTNKEMAHAKEELMETFFKTYEEQLNEKGLKRKNMKIVQYYSAIPTLEQWFDIDVKKKLIYDILVTTISFCCAKSTGREVVLYTDNKSVKYLSHLNYDKIVVVPEEFEPKNGLACGPLVYAMQNENLETCFINNEFIFGNKLLLNFMDFDLESKVSVYDIDAPKRIYFWDNLLNLSDNILTFLSPELLTENEHDTDWAFLCFNDEEIKQKLIDSYLTNVKIYEKSLYCEWWKLYKFIKPDVRLFGNKLGELMKNEKFFALHYIKCDGKPDKLVPEKMDFFESRPLYDLKYEKNSNEILLERVKKLGEDLYKKTKDIINDIEHL